MRLAEPPKQFADLVRQSCLARPRSTGKEQRWKPGIHGRRLPGPGAQCKASSRADRQFGARQPRLATPKLMTPIAAPTSGSASRRRCRAIANATGPLASRCGTETTINQTTVDVDARFPVSESGVRTTAATARIDAAAHQRTAVEMNTAPACAYERVTARLLGSDITERSFTDKVCISTEALAGASPAPSGGSGRAVCRTTCVVEIGQ